MFKSLLTKMPAIALGLASVGLLSASPVSSTTYTGSVTLTHSEADNYFVFSGNGGAVQGAQGFGVTNPVTGQTDFVPAGTFPVTKTVPGYISGGVVTALGLYSPTGVSVAVNQSVYDAAVNKETWDQVFAGTSEASIATALANGDQNTLLAFLNKYSNDFVTFSTNTQATYSGGILDFSNATPGGSITFTNITAVGGPGSATPEPSTYMLFSAGLGLAAVAARRLRKA